MAHDAGLGVRRRVGVPIHERRLTDSFLNQVPTVFRPGVGRSNFVLQEVELGAGRPDLVIVTMSPTAFAAFRSSGLRLSSPAAARAVDLTTPLDKLGISRGYATALRKQLASDGWFDVDPQKVASIVTDSIAIEAKIADWRSAVRQVAKFRRHFHRSAILMPWRHMPPETAQPLAVYECGLIFQDGDSFNWDREARRVEPSVSSMLWLLELAMRSVERGT